MNSDKFSVTVSFEGFSSVVVIRSGSSNLMRMTICSADASRASQSVRPSASRTSDGSIVGELATCVVLAALSVPSSVDSVASDSAASALVSVEADS